MNLSNLRSRILYKCGRAVDTTLNSDITYALETVQDEVIAQIGFPELFELDETTILLVANTQTYNLPTDFLKMAQIWDTAEYNQELKRITSIEYKTYLGDVTGQTGTNPIYYDIIDSTTSSGNYVKRIKFFPYPLTILNGQIATIAQNSGVPASFANYNTTVSGAILITDTAHGLQTDMRVTIAGTTNYNGTFTITRVSADTFYIIATYVAEAGGGTWTAVGADITDVSHGLTTGDSITIAGTTNYNGVVSVIVKDADTFYIATTYVAEAGAITKTWIKNCYIPFTYYKTLSYMSADTDENVLAYKYPNLLIEGATYYIYRDVVYRDQPEKIAFRLGEYRRCIDNIKKSITESDKIHMVLPKRLLGVKSKLFYPQYTGYTS